MGWINCEPWGRPLEDDMSIGRPKSLALVQTPMECVQWVGPNAEGKTATCWGARNGRTKSPLSSSAAIIFGEVYKSLYDVWVCIKHLGPTKSDRTLHDYDLHGSSFTFEPACHLRKDKETCCRCLLYLSLSLLQLLCRVGFPSQRFVFVDLEGQYCLGWRVFSRVSILNFYSPWLMKMQVPFFLSQWGRSCRTVCCSKQWNHHAEQDQLPWNCGNIWYLQIMVSLLPVTTTLWRITNLGHMSHMS